MKNSTLTIPNDPSFLGVVRSYIEAVAGRIGFDLQQVRHIQQAVDEACSHIIATSFEPGEEATLTITGQESDVGLHVVIADQGLPFNPALVVEYDPQAGLDRELGGIGFYLIKQMMDQVRFVHKGPEGNELHLTKYLDQGSITTFLSEEELQPYDDRVEPAPPGTYDLRLMRPVRAEAVEVSRCVYRTYGYTYPGEHIYYPDRLIEMNRRGEMLSIVAVSDTGEVAGHCAISGPPEAPIREIGQAAVDPAHRNRNLLTRLLRFAVEEARRRGLAGLVGEPVTNHPFSQRASAHLGFQDTALLLGYIPQSVFFKKIGDQALGRRMTLLYNFLPLGDCGRSRIYAPLHHRTMLRRIYDGLGLQRTLVEPPAVLPRRPDQSRLSTEVLSAINAAHIILQQPGRYAATEVRIKLNELIRKGVACVHLDLPLTDPATATLCAHCEMAGFTLAGIIPQADGNDLLRLQHLNEIPIDWNEMVIYSEAGQALKRYLQEQHR